MSSGMGMLPMLPVVPGPYAAAHAAAIVHHVEGQALQHMGVGSQARIAAPAQGVDAQDI